jgi:hypothetical protein
MRAERNTFQHFESAEALMDVEKFDDRRPGEATGGALVFAQGAVGDHGADARHDMKASAFPLRRPVQSALLEGTAAENLIH